MKILGAWFYIITNTIAWFIKKNWFNIITNAIAWFYSYPPEKIRDTRRWLCAGGKHTGTCDHVAISFGNNW